MTTENTGNIKANRHNKSVRTSFITQVFMNIGSTAMVYNMTGRDKQLWPSICVSIFDFALDTPDIHKRFDGKVFDMILRPLGDRDFHHL